MCEVIASSNTFRVKQKRLHLGIIDKVMTLVREIEGCGMIMERVGGLRSRVPAPEEWSQNKKKYTMDLRIYFIMKT